jgi:lipopolysaccharide export system protein LptA
VVCLLKAGERSRTAGLFSAGRAVSVTADRLAFRAGPGTTVFSGKVRLSQDADSLIAGEIEISEAAAELRGRGGVTAALTCPVTKAAPDGRVELGGEEVVFSASGRTLVFKGKSRIRLAGAKLDAATVTAVLGGEGTVVESLEARMGVVLARGRYEGRAAAADYQAATDRIVLTGNPVLTDKEGGSARGDKLTFDLADDKILIENEGQGRSTTVVRS